MVHWIYPRVGYSTIAQAIAAPLPAIPTVGNYFPRVMALVMKGDRTTLPTAGTTNWIDIRPLISSQVMGIVTDHGNLAGLTDDDHTQYGALAQAETITENWVNTTYPWADNEIASASTWNALVTNATHTGDVTGATALTIAGDSVNDTHINWGVGTNQVSAVDVPIADGGDIISATEVESALQEHRTAINLNTAKNTNVSTALSEGTRTATTYGITSDGGANDIALPEATTDYAGLLGADKWDEIVTNTDSIDSISTAVRDVVSVDNLSRVIVDTLFIGSMSVYIYNLNDSLMFVDDHYGPFSLGMIYNSSTPGSPSTGAESRWFLENDGTDEEGNHALSANGGATYGTDGTPPQGTYYGNVNASGRYFSYDSISYGDHFTIATEIWPTAGGYQTVWSMYKDQGGSISDGIEIQVDQTNDDIYVITSDGTNTTTGTALNCGVAAEEWQSLIVIVDRAGGTCGIWLDGVDVTTSAPIRTNFDNSSPAWFGRSGDDDKQFYGYLDALQLYFWEITEANVGTINTTPGVEVTQ